MGIPSMSLGTGSHYRWSPTCMWMATCSFNQSTSSEASPPQTRCVVCPSLVCLLSSLIRPYIHLFPEHLLCARPFFFLINFFNLFFLAVLGLRFCARAFSSCDKRGPLFIAVRGPLTVAASLVVEHRLQTRRLSSCGSRA